MSYAFATPVMAKWVDDRFRGEWKYLRKACFEMPVVEVDLALLELATQLRALDDHHKLSDYFKQTGHAGFGKVFKDDGSEEQLYRRDMTNKIMHSSSIEWRLSDPNNPIIICHSPDPKRWVKAEIELFLLAGFMGGLIS